MRRRVGSVASGRRWPRIRWRSVRHSSARKRVEVAMAQPLFGAEGDVGVQFVLFGFGRSPCVARAGRTGGERIGETVVALGRRQAVAYLRQQQRAQLALPVGIAPEQIEGGVEDLAFVGRGDQQRGKRGAHVVAAAEVDPAQARRAHRRRAPATSAGPRRAARARNARRCARSVGRSSSSGTLALSSPCHRLRCQTLRDLRGVDARQVVLILEQHAERVLHRLRIEFSDAQALPARGTSRSFPRCRAP